VKETANGASGREVAKTPGKQGKARRHRTGPFQDLGVGASPEAKRLAVAILEVLAGTRTPTEAAQILGISLPRYYVLENRAVQSMLVACERRSTGRVRTAESALAALQRECEQLRRECARLQALLRAAQRTIGLTAPAAAHKPEKNGKKRRKRRPTARALRAVARLQEDEPLPMTENASENS
jgi:hypothetical protein